MKLKKLIIAIAALTGAIAFPLSAFATFMPVQGGSGSSQIPTYGQLLVGNSAGVYVPTATSSLGISGSGTLTTLTAGSGISFSSGATCTTTCTITSTGGGTSAFPFTVTTYGVSTSTTIAFLNGLFSTASSTFGGPFRLSALSNGELAVYGGLVGSYATTTAGTGLSYSAGSFTVNNSQSISTLSNLNTNGFVKTSGGAGALSVDTNTYLTGSGAGVTAVSVASANGLAGSSSGGATPALTLSTTITANVVKANGTAFSAASNGTDYTLLTATTCSAGSAVTALTAAGGVTCGNAFSTTSADAYINASSTIAHPAGGALGNVMQWNGSNWTSVATSTLGLGGSGGGSVTSVNASGGTTGLTFSGGPITTSGTLSLAGTLIVANGGTGLTATGASSTVLTTDGTNPKWNKLATSQLTNDSGFLTSAVSSLAQTYGTAQTGAISFGTSTDAFNGLNFNETITNSGTSFTFANVVTGSLGAGGGGTGITNPTAAQLLLGSYAGGGWQQLATSSLGINFSSLAGTASLTSQVTGVLPIANGGTNASSFTTTGNATYYDGTRLLTAPLTSAITIPYASTTQATFNSNVYMPSISCLSNTCLFQANTGTGNGLVTGVAEGYGVNQLLYGGSNAINGSSNFTLDGTLLTAKNATTTLLSASYASSTLYYGANLASCNSASNALTWNAGTFGCNSISSGGTYPFNVATNATTTIVRFNGGLTAQASSTIGDGTQAGGLTITGGATTTGNVLIGSITASTTFSVDSLGHIMTGGTQPTCGTGCSTVVGDDNSMRVVTGTTITTATVNFANTWKNSAGVSITPTCTASEESAGTITADASSTPSTVILEFASALTSTRIAVQCMASDNFSS